MEVQALSPEMIQDTLPTSDAISADQIDSTFGTTCIGRPPNDFSLTSRPIDLTDLASSALNSHIIYHTDDFFASSSNLLNPAPPISRPGHYIESGAWYDGWETRRHNPSPPDYVIVRLGVAAGRIKGIEVDTAFFDGNHAEAVEVWGCNEPGKDGDERVKGERFEGWKRVLDRRECEANRRHAWSVRDVGEYTHVKLCMFPDGGIARFRVYGVAVPVWPSDPEEEVELSAAFMGGVAVACSDEHFGKMGNLLLRGRGVDMGDGWETKRSRRIGHVDWVIVKLGARGRVRRVVVDTMHFRGNFPQAVGVQGLDAEREEEVREEDKRWIEVVSLRKCEKDREHEFGASVLRNVEGRVFTHMKMFILPDGGVKRFRVFGTRA